MTCFQPIYSLYSICSLYMYVGSKLVVEGSRRLLLPFLVEGGRSSHSPTPPSLPSPYNPAPGVVAVDDALYSQCCVKDLEQCRAVAEKVPAAGARGRRNCVHAPSGFYFLKSPKIPFSPPQVLKYFVSAKY